MSSTEVAQCSAMLLTSLPDDWDPDHHASEGAHLEYLICTEKEKKHLKSSNLAPTLVHFSLSLLGTLSPKATVQIQKTAGQRPVSSGEKKKKATDDALKC